MVKFLATILLTINFFSVTAQNFGEYLKTHAVKIDNLDILNKPVYDLLSEYRLIMIGEMHGTNEPANFVSSLTDLFTRNGDSVMVGFEIPSDQMLTFTDQHSDSSIFHSEFFTKSSVDGRATVAWVKAIASVSKNPKAMVFFFDVNGKYSGDRDSLMYLNIKSKMMEHLNWKTITLSGNVHNMLLPYNGKIKTGNFLLNDEELDLGIGDKVCSLNHQYAGGTMLNNQGDGLKLHDLGTNNSIYSQMEYEFYLCLNPFFLNDPYSGVFFTRQVSAAELTKNK
jgi:hypothetical protein